MDNIAGNALTHAGARTLSAEQVSTELPQQVAAMIHNRLEQHPQKTQEKLEQVRMRYRFLDGLRK